MKAKFFQCEADLPAKGTIWKGHINECPNDLVGTLSVAAASRPWVAIEKGLSRPIEEILTKQELQVYFLLSRWINGGHSIGSTRVGCVIWRLRQKGISIEERPDPACKNKQGKLYRLRDNDV